MRIRTDSTVSDAFTGNGFVQFQDKEADVIPNVAIRLLASSPDKYKISAKIIQDFKEWQNDVIYDAPIGYHNGYGHCAMKLGEALSKYLDLYFVSGRWHGRDEKEQTAKLIELQDKEIANTNAPYFMLFPAWEFSRSPMKHTIGYTMLECSLVPESWTNNINNYLDLCIVPCQQNKQMMIDSGVTVPVEVVPLGIDPEEYQYIERENTDDEFWFGTMGTLTYRKGTDVLVKAFIRAFTDKSNVKLLIKTTGSALTYAWYLTREQMNKYKNQIMLQTDVYTVKEMNEHFFAKIDAFAFPSRGEGFGLPPLEAMATGLPVIATAYSGLADFMDSRYSYPLSFSMIPVPNNEDGKGYPEGLKRDGQMWAEPDEDQLVELLLHIYNNQKEAKEKGKKASQEVLKNWTYDKSAQKLAKLIKNYIKKHV
jgi:glycosyltransferase involved in cell wall biosynthesis